MDKNQNIVICTTPSNSTQPRKVIVCNTSQSTTIYISCTAAICKTRNVCIATTWTIHTTTTCKTRTATAHTTFTATAQSPV